MPIDSTQLIPALRYKVKNVLGEITSVPEALTTALFATAEDGTPVLTPPYLVLAAQEPRNVTSDTAVNPTVQWIPVEFIYVDRSAQDGTTDTPQRLRGRLDALSDALRADFHLSLGQVGVNRVTDTEVLSTAMARQTAIQSFFAENDPFVIVQVLTVEFRQDYSFEAGDAPPPPADGTVTSVGLSMPLEFLVSGSPVTTSGILTVTKAPAVANRVYAGPASGANAVPTFRSLVANDIPALPYTFITGLGTAATHNDPEYEHVVRRGVAGGYAPLDGTGKVPAANLPALGESGTVTSVDMSVPPEFSLAGNPITTAGTIALSKTVQSANRVWAGPASGSGVPTFRSLVTTDLPTLALSQISDAGTAAAHNDSEYEHVAVKGIAGGYAPLDGTGKVPVANLPPLGNPGTVTSVNLAAPAEFVVSGNPITSAGTLTLTKVSQAAHAVWAGPTSGSAVPSFRALLAADIPTLPSTQISGLGTAATHADTDYEHIVNKGVAGGYAPLDGTGKVPVVNLPASGGGSSTLAGLSDVALTAPTNNQLLTYSGSIAKWINQNPPAAGGTGTVTSVELAAPPEFTVTGSPIVSAGVITLSKAAQAPNNIWAGPASGANAVPAFRALVAADIPTITLSKISDAGTAASHADSDYEHVAMKGAGLGYASLDALVRVPLAQLPTLVASGASHSAGIAPDPGATAGTTRFLREDATWAATPSGTVTSVALSAPTEFTVTGSPITGSGTLTITKVVQSANRVYAGPASGGAVAPTFRALVAADIPPLTLSKISDAGTAAAHNDSEYEHVSRLGAANGYAPLNASSLVPLSYLPPLGALSLDELSDVNLIGLANNQVLTYSTSLGAWYNTTVPPGFLTDLGDVVINTPINNQVLTWNSSSSRWINQTPPVYGSVSSVALVTPSEFTVTGSPITTAGTLTIVKAIQPANQVYAGPATGSAVQPTFRALVAADIPTDYVLQVGRSGGQQVAGGVATGENLLLLGSNVTDFGTITHRAAAHVWQSDATTERMRLVSTGRLGIGTTTPVFKLHIVGEAADLGLSLRVQADAVIPQIQLNRARGSLATPTVVQAGDVLGRLLTQAYDSAAFQTAARLDVVAATTPTPAANVMTGEFVFSTNSGGTTLVERMRLDKAGFLGIGSAAPQGLLHLSRATATDVIFDCYGTAARPVLYLDAARGTPASPLASIAADQLGQIVYRGHDGTNWVQGAQVYAQATAAPIGTRIPSNVIVGVTNDAGTAIEVIRFTSSRRVGINSSSVPAAMLQVTTSDAATITAAFGGTSGQTANVAQFSVPGLIGFKINYAAVPVWHILTEPPDGDLVAGDLTMWFDQTVGASKAMFKGKNSAGTVVKGQLALT